MSLLLASFFSNPFSDRLSVLNTHPHIHIVPHIERVEKDYAIRHLPENADAYRVDWKLGMGGPNLTATLYIEHKTHKVRFVDNVAVVTRDGMRLPLPKGFSQYTTHSNEVASLETDAQDKHPHFEWVDALPLGADVMALLNLEKDENFQALVCSLAPARFILFGRDAAPEEFSAHVSETEVSPMEKLILPNGTVGEKATGPYDMGLTWTLKDWPVTFRTITTGSGQNCFPTMAKTDYRYSDDGPWIPLIGDGLVLSNGRVLPARLPLITAYPRKLFSAAHVFAKELGLKGAE